jgi:cytochrome c oxidase cbb3-type subunit 4
MSYDALRHFADSWGLVAMTVIFLVCIGWAFRPHSGAANRRAAHSIFENEDRIDG